jgi:hypothetical protein
VPRAKASSERAASAGKKEIESTLQRRHHLKGPNALETITYELHDIYLTLGNSVAAVLPGAAGLVAGEVDGMLCMQAKLINNCMHAVINLIEKQARF